MKGGEEGMLVLIGQGIAYNIWDVATLQNAVLGLLCAVMAATL